MTDERALLAAIVADPADDTVRLAYADCIEDRGNAARAAFIRLQVEAERLHPDSNARAELERRAEALFAEHWIDWWGEVCAEVGFPRPAPKPSSKLGRFVRRVGLATPAGDPYEAKGTAVYHNAVRFYGVPIPGWGWARFRRGFPDSLQVSFGRNFTAQPSLPGWTTAAPLASLTAVAPFEERWPDGPHLAGVWSLHLEDHDSPVLYGALESPHLTNLRELRLRLTNYNDGEAARFADELARTVAFPRVRQLERLSVPVWTERAAETVASAPLLSGLRTLEVQTHPEQEEDEATPRERLAVLARSPHLAALRELTVSGACGPDGLRAVVERPAWAGLRKLTFECELTAESLAALLAEPTLPDLEELRLGSFYPVGKRSTPSSHPHYSNNSATWRSPPGGASMGGRRPTFGACRRCSTSAGSRRSGSTRTTGCPDWTNSRGNSATDSACRSACREVTRRCGAGRRRCRARSRSAPGSPAPAAPASAPGRPASPGRGARSSATGTRWPSGPRRRR